MQHPPLSDVFGALADPTRLAIVERLLSEGECTVGDLAEPFAISKPAISKHLGVLEKAGLIERHVVRQWRYCRVRPDALAAIDDWMRRYREFWETSLDRLAKLMERKRDRKNEGSKPDER